MNIETQGILFFIVLLFCSLSLMTNNEVDLISCFNIQSNETNVCGGIGNCSSTDNCTCFDNTLSVHPNCISKSVVNSTCFGIMENSSLVDYICSGNGFCFGDDICICNSGFEGDQCEYKIGESLPLYNCFGENVNSPDVCGGNGWCYGNNTCLCKPNFNGSYCYFNQELGESSFYCEGLDPSDPRVCSSSRGICVKENDCYCKEGITGSNCELDSDYKKLFDCFSPNPAYNEECEGHGLCIEQDTCVCDIGFEGEYCETQIYLGHTCYGIHPNDTNVCGKHGVCVAQDECVCDDGYQGNEDFNACQIDSNTNYSLFSCFYYEAGHRNACSQNGWCVGTSTCFCFTGYEGTNCEKNSTTSEPLYTCFGLNPDNDQVCSSNGFCIGENTCGCTGVYNGLYCHLDRNGNSIYECFGFDPNSKDVCSGENGWCVEEDTCICKDFWEGENCSFCNNTRFNEDCNSCTQEFEGIDCSIQKKTCSGILYDDNAVCSGNGDCIFSDFCFCNDGWNGSDCQIPKCGEILATEENVCSWHGDCKMPGECTCDKGYLGDDCESFKCGDYFANDSQVCSGSGECTGPDTCTCNSILTIAIKEGDNCQTISAQFLFFSGSFGVLAIIIFALIMLLGILVCFLKKTVVKKKEINAKVIELQTNHEKIETKKNEEENKILQIIKENKFRIPDPENIKIQKTISQGAFGVVKKATYQVVGMKIPVAVKEVFIDNKVVNVDDIINEVSIMGNLSHPNVMKCFGFFVKDNVASIVMEYCGGGDLFIERANKDLTMIQRLNYVYQIASGMKYLHSKSIIHRDLKSQNVLISNKVAKISDFGTSKSEYRISSLSTFVGTVEYMAPEMSDACLDSSNKKLMDIYSFGILVHEIISGKQPYADLRAKKEELNSNQFKLLSLIQKKNLRPNLDDLKGHHPELIKLVQQCWEKEPLQRPQSFDEICDRLDKINEVVLQKRTKKKEILKRRLSGIMTKKNENLAPVETEKEVNENTNVEKNEEKEEDDDEVKSYVNPSIESANGKCEGCEDNENSENSNNENKENSKTMSGLPSVFEWEENSDDSSSDDSD